MAGMEETDYALKRFYIGCSLAVACMKCLSDEYMSCLVIFIDPSLDTQKSLPSKFSTSTTASTTCSSEAVTATSQPSRSHSVPLNPRVQLDSAEYKIHVVDVAYIYMKEDGHLDFLPPQTNPDGNDDKGTFKLVTVPLLELILFLKQCLKKYL